MKSEIDMNFQTCLEQKYKIISRWGSQPFKKVKDQWSNTIIPFNECFESNSLTF